jgi:NADH:ubiquinone oxidoreductase subunit 2 (subunit N)
LKFFYSFDSFICDSILYFFIALLVFSLVFVFVKAINEFNFFKLFAYSGIGNYCFALLPFFLSKNFNMALPLFFYLYIYCLTLIGFFLLLSISF